MLFPVESTPGLRGGCLKPPPFRKEQAPISREVNHVYHYQESTRCNAGRAN